MLEKRALSIFSTKKMILQNCCHMKKQRVSSKNIYEESIIEVDQAVDKQDIILNLLMFMVFVNFLKFAIYRNLFF